MVELHKTLLKQKCFVQCNKRSQWQRGEVDNPVYTEVQRKQLVVNNGGRHRSQQKEASTLSKWERKQDSSISQTVALININIEIILTIKFVKHVICF